MADTNVGVFLRPDMKVKTYVNQARGPWMTVQRTVVKEGNEHEVDVTDLTFYLPEQAEDRALVCDTMIAAFQHVKDSS